MRGMPIQLSRSWSRLHFGVSLHCINHLCFVHIWSYVGNAYVIRLGFFRVYVLNRQNHGYNFVQKYYKESP